MNPHIIVVAAALTLSGIGSAQSRIQDSILTKDGRRIRGVEIVEATSSGVAYTQGSDTRQVVAPRDIAEIEWFEPPEAYALARSAMRTGAYEQAATQFKDAVAGTDRAPLKAECSFLAGEALVRAAEVDAAQASRAVDWFTNWVSTNSGALREPDASLLLGRAQRLANDTAGAETTLRKLVEDTLAKNWEPVWSSRARYEQALAQIAAGHYAEARTTFRAALASLNSADASAEMLAIESEARVGIGDSMIREGNFREALEYLRELVRTATTDPIRAAGRAGEGEALLLQAKANNDGKGLRAAQIALAEANILDSASSETTAKSLYYSGEVLLALGAERAGSDFKAQAMAYFQSVAKSYPDTTWAPRAAEALRQ